MKPTLLRTALIVSVLLNVGVLGAVAYRAWQGDAPRPPATALPQLLQLDAAQLQRWHASEADFLAQLKSSTHDIGRHRNRLIHAIFAEPTDEALIEAERAAIAALQNAQQQLVIRQLLAERALLTPAQRQQLAALLLAQPVGPSSIERLHRDE